MLNSYRNILTGDGYLTEDVRTKVISFVVQVLAEHGNIRAKRDRDSFVQQTGAGATKFNAWMKKLGLYFVRSEGVWQPPEGMPVAEYRRALRSMIRKKKVEEGAKNGPSEVMEPTADDGWPLLESTVFFDENLSFQKYTSDEIIKLARSNPGVGLNKFVKCLYPSSQRNAFSQMEEVLREYGSRTGEDLIEHLQKHGPTESEFFNWAGLAPAFLRTDQSSFRKGRESMFSLTSITDLNHDFHAIYQHHQDGYTFGEISRLLEIPYQIVAKYCNKFDKWVEKEITDKWLELVDLLKFFSISRGHTTLSDERGDHLILYLRRVTRTYINTPEGWSSRPKLAGLIQFFELASASEVEQDEVDGESKSNIEQYLFLDELNHNKNFRMSSMIENSFFEPLITLVRHQLSEHVKGLRIEMGEKVSNPQALEFVKRLRDEFSCKLYLSSISDELLDLITEELDSEQIMVEVYDSKGVEKVVSCSNLRVVCLPHIGFLQTDSQYSYLESMNDLLVESGFPADHIYLKPLALPFFSDDASVPNSVGTFGFKPYAGSDYLELLQRLAKNYNNRIICDCEPFKSSISSVDHAHKILHRAATELCINSGAKYAVVNYLEYESMDLYLDSEFFTLATQAILAQNELFFKKSFNGFRSVHRLGS